MQSQRELLTFKDDNFESLQSYKFIMNKAEKDKKILTIETLILLFLIEIHKVYPRSYVTINTISKFLKKLDYKFSRTYSKKRKVIEGVAAFCKNDDQNDKNRQVYLTENVMTKLLSHHENQLIINSDLVVISEINELKSFAQTFSTQQSSGALLSKTNSERKQLLLNKYKSNDHYIKFIHAFIAWLDLIKENKKANHKAAGKTLDLNRNTIHRFFTNFFQNDVKLKLPKSMSEVNDFDWKRLFGTKLPQDEIAIKKEIIDEVIQLVFYTIPVMKMNVITLQTEPLQQSIPVTIPVPTQPQVATPITVQLQEWKASKYSEISPPLKKQKLASTNNKDRLFAAKSTNELIENWKESRSNTATKAASTVATTARLTKTSQFLFSNTNPRPASTEAMIEEYEKNNAARILSNFDFISQSPSNNSSHSKRTIEDDSEKEVIKNKKTNFGSR